MVPCLALERLERIHFDELFGIGAHQMDLSILGGNEHQAGVFQQQQLAFAVAAPFPHPVAGLEIQAREEATVVAINVSLISHHVREIRFQVTGGPEFLRHEFALDLGDANRFGCRYSSGCRAARYHHPRPSVAGRGSPRTSIRNSAAPCPSPAPPARVRHWRASAPTLRRQWCSIAAMRKNDRPSPPTTGARRSPRRMPADHCRPCRRPRRSHWNRSPVGNLQSPTSALLGGRPPSNPSATPCRRS